MEVTQNSCLHCCCNYLKNPAGKFSVSIVLFTGACMSTMIPIQIIQGLAIGTLSYFSAMTLLSAKFQKRSFAQLVIGTLLSGGISVGGFAIKTNSPYPRFALVVLGVAIGVCVSYIDDICAQRQRQAEGYKVPEE